VDLLKEIPINLKNFLEKLAEIQERASRIFREMLFDLPYVYSPHLNQFQVGLKI
jgi:hypothetical protein